MIRRPPRSTQSRSSAASDVYKRQQETFLSALKSIDKFRRDCPEKSWLYNILRNKIIDYYRKKTNQEIKRSSSNVESDDDSYYGHYFSKDAGTAGSWNESA